METIPENSETLFTFPVSNGFVQFEVVQGHLQVTALSRSGIRYTVGITDCTSDVHDLVNWLKRISFLE